MKKPDKAVVFRKKDALQFPRMFHQLRLFKMRGCLFFISCETPDVEHELAERIVNKMTVEFACCPIFVSPTMIDPFIEIEKYFIANPQPQIKPLFLIRNIVSITKAEEALDRFFQGINLNRDKIGQQNLGMIFFVDDSLLNLIIFKAPDFFTFKSGIFRFGDEAKVRREIAQKPQEPSDNELRLAFLTETFKTQADDLSEVAKANLAGEIGNLHYKLSNLHDALKYDEMALPLFRKSMEQRGEANQLGNIGLIYHDMGELGQAMKKWGQRPIFSRMTRRRMKKVY